MADTATFQFPNLAVSDKEKNEEWHKKFVQAITNQSVNNTYSLASAAMNECVNFYQGMQNGDEFNFLQEAEDGETLPAQWINYNKIKVKIDLLLGELVQKGYDISVKALNKDAKVRKLEEKKRLRVEMRLRGLAQALEEQYSLPMQTGEFIPEDEEELDEYFDKNYKEEAEIIMESAIKFLAKRNNWDYERLAMFRDILIMGRCFAKSEIVDGLPKTRRIDPRLMIFDGNATDDFLSDATYFGEVQYKNISDVAAMYGLTTKEIKDVYNSYQDHQAARFGSGAGSSDFKVLDNSDLQFFKMEAGELRVLIVSATWVDTKMYNHRISTDKYGNEHVKRVDDTKKGNDIKKTRIKIWRQGTLIGGKIFKEWGEIPNQPRNIENLAETESPYKGLIPNYLNGAGISKVFQLKGLQNLKDITMYNIQLAMARAGAKGFIYDVSQVPDEWDVHTVIKYLKTVGIAFIDSKKDGIPSQFNQFSQIDMTLSSSVDNYINISLMVDREMDAISGINEARQGLVQSASQAVGVTQSALLQSNLSTATYFKLFETYSSKLLNDQGRLVKIAWAGKERFAPIIGDTGIDFLANDVDLELNDYGVFVEAIPPMLDDLQSFQQIVMAALQTGQLDFIDAVKLLREKDITLAIRKLEKDLKRKRKEEMEREDQMMQAQAQQEQAMLEAERERVTMEKQIDTAGDIELQEVKTVGDLQKILTKARADLAGKKIDFKKELELLKHKPKPTSSK